MEHDRNKIYKIISTMLDNPDANGIYPTTKAYDALENYVEECRTKAIGWMYAKACALMDTNEDIRVKNVPEICGWAMHDLSKEGNS